MSDQISSVSDTSSRNAAREAAKKAMIEQALKWGIEAEGDSNKKETDPATGETTSSSTRSSGSIASQASQAAKGTVNNIGSSRVAGAERGTNLSNKESRDGFSKRVSNTANRVATASLKNTET